VRKETREGKADVAPGTLFEEKKELHVLCGGTTVLRVLTVKAEGRKQVTAAEFVNGAHLEAGERFGIT
jgi:methionyl-tRNA formyltransferase